MFTASNTYDNIRKKKFAVIVLIKHESDLLPDHLNLSNSQHFSKLKIQTYQKSLCIKLIVHIVTVKARFNFNLGIFILQNLPLFRVDISSWSPQYRFFLNLGAVRSNIGIRFRYSDF